MTIGLSTGESYETMFHLYDGLENPITQASDRQGEGSQGSPSNSIYVVRHGCTDMNAEGGTSADKIRGWSNVPLNDVGREDAHRAAESLKDKGITAIVASDLDRSKETASIIGKTLGIEPEYTMKLRPWDLGKFTGQPATESKEALREYSTTKADQTVPEGESFNDFKNRAFQGVSEAILDHPEDKVAIVTHHRVERLLNAWDEAGQPSDGSLHEPTFLQKGGSPGSHQEMEISNNIHQLADASALTPEALMESYKRRMMGDTFEVAAERTKRGVKSLYKTTPNRSLAGPPRWSPTESPDMDLTYPSRNLSTEPIEYKEPPSASFQRIGDKSLHDMAEEDQFDYVFKNIDEFRESNHPGIEHWETIKQLNNGKLGVRIFRVPPPETEKEAKIPVG